MKSVRHICVLMVLACLVSAMSGVALAQKATIATSETMLAVPVPIVVPGAPTCADLNASSNPAFAYITEDWGFRINRSGVTPFDQTYPFLNSTVTQLMGGAAPSPARFVHAALGGNTLSWNSNRGISAVIVQGGALGANVYPYNPSSFGGFPNSDGSALLTAGGCATIENVTFCFQALEPTAAHASVSGRVTNSAGVGIGGARMTLMNAQTGETFIALTNNFGYYVIDGGIVGSVYVLTVSHRRYTFVDSTRIFTLNDDIVDANFIGGSPE